MVAPVGSGLITEARLGGIIQESQPAACIPGLTVAKGTGVCELGRDKEISPITPCGSEEGGEEGGGGGGGGVTRWGH